MAAYRPIGMPAAWGKEVDHNLLPDGRPKKSQAISRDLHSAAGRPDVRGSGRGAISA